MSTDMKFLKDIENGEEFNADLMIMKIIYRDPQKVVCVLADKTEDLKGSIQNNNDELEIGMVINVKGKKDGTIIVKEYTILKEYNLEDYLPHVKRPIDDIMNDINNLTNRYILTKEGKALDEYFFKNEQFLSMFKKAIGGVSMHHNYIGGLAEHTLNVMYLASVLCERYNCRNTEIAVLAAKLHDIGKIYELEYNGPFRYTLRGSMEGHIVIGVELVNEAFKEIPISFSEDFINRIKGCITQHHGTLEYGSPKERNMEESFIVNFADSIDATMSRIVQIKDKTPENQWSEYDRKLETKIYL